MIGHLTAALALAAAAVGPVETPLSVRFVKPAESAAVFGPVEVVVEVAGAAANVAVELYVDGMTVAVLTEMPFRVVVDVGGDNAEHRFEAVARESGGGSAWAAVVTPAIAVNDAITVELNQLYVTARQGGQRVDDLQQWEFTVEDDGRQEEIVTFARGDIPFTAALLVDGSLSMAGAKLDRALSGVRAFAAGMRPLDEARLLVFSDRIRRATPFTTFPEVLLAGIAGLHGEGGSAINDALMLALALLDARQGRRVVVLLSDGVDSHSVLTIRDVLPRFRRSRAIVYWLRMEAADGRSTEAPALYSPWRSPPEYREQLRLLESAVEQSGGRVVGVRNAAEIEPAFAALLTELREQYVLGYYPTERRHDGTFRRIRVRTRRPGVSLVSASGWVDM